MRSASFRFLPSVARMAGRCARESVSQAVLARHLNVGTKLVSDWERGVKRPSGPSLKLLVLASTEGLDAVA